MKPLPHNQVAEEQVIACLLYDPRLIESIGDLCACDFYSTGMMSIANKVISELRLGVSIAEIGKCLAKGNLFEKYLQIINYIPLTHEFDKYVTAVKQASRKRQAIQTLYDSAELLRDDEERKYSELTGKIIDDIVSALGNDGSEQTCAHVSDVMQEAFDRVLTLHAGDGEDCAIKTGLYGLDKVLSGLWPGDLVVVAARPKMGKSAFALSVSDYVATEYKAPVILFTLEMTNQQEAIRILSKELETNSSHIRNGTVGHSSYGEFERVINKYKDIPLEFDDKACASIGHIRTVIMKVKRKYGALRLVVVDYLQLMSSEGKQSREREVAALSASLKGIAKDYKIPVIALSQLNRSVETRNNKRPLLSDLRESGAIEQDADAVIFLYRDDYYNPDSVDAGLVEIIVGAQRSGPTGTVKVLFDRELTRFRNYTEYGYDQRTEKTKERNGNARRSYYETDHDHE